MPPLPVAAQPRPRRSAAAAAAGLQQAYNSWRIEQSKKKKFTPLEDTAVPAAAAPEAEEVSAAAATPEPPAAAAKVEEPVIAAPKEEPAAVAAPATPVAAPEPTPEPPTSEPELKVIATSGAGSSPAAEPEAEPVPEGPPPPGQRFGPDGRPIRITAKYVLVGSGTASYVLITLLLAKTRRYCSGHRLRACLQARRRCTAVPA